MSEEMKVKLVRGLRYGFALGWFGALGMFTGAAAARHDLKESTLHLVALVMWAAAMAFTSIGDRP